MTTIHIFYNSKSGKDDKNAIIKQLIDFLTSNGYQRSNIHLISPNNAEDAYQLAKQASKMNVDIIVAIGGDGTINKIAGGIYDGGSHSTLAIIPAGSVNNFAKSLNYSMDILETFQYIIQGKTRLIDLCQVNQTYMISSLTMGLLADIAASVKSEEKRKLGPLAFLKNAWPTLRRNRTYHLTLTLNGTRTTIKTKFLLISTTNSIGGMTNFHPSASADDGILRVYTMENYSFWRFFHYWIAIQQGNFKNLPEIHYFKATNIRIALKKNRRFQSARTRIDGDKSEKLPVEITLIPKALRIFIPHSSS